MKNFLLAFLTATLLLFLIYLLGFDIEYIIVASIAVTFFSVIKEYSFALKEWKENEIRYNSIIDSKKIESEKEINYERFD